MNNKLNDLKRLLDEYGHDVERGKTIVDVVGTPCLDKGTPSSPGVYWIETTMPIEEMRRAISEVLGKERRLRKKPPTGTKLIQQKGTDFYVVYSGTEEDINKRLKQHLFNQGHADTVKLGCVIDEEPFTKYKWRISFATIDSYEFRYAVEAWWRRNVGWPAFCLK